MTDFVNQFHRPSMIGVFEAFSRGLAHYYDRYEKERATDEDFRKILVAFTSVTVRNSDEIMRATGAEIMRYMYYYEVETREGVDEYKIIYFMGWTIARFLEKEGHASAASVVRYAVVVMLNERLKKYLPGGRPELLERLTRIIRDRAVEQRLGTDGLYLLYKCSSRMLKDAEKVRETALAVV